MQAPTRQPYPELNVSASAINVRRTGRNFAAGMSGGVAYVYDVDGTFSAHCNPAMVELTPVRSESEQSAAEADYVAAGKGRNLHKGRADEPQLRELVERHLRFTGSTLALKILDDWDVARTRFVKVFPHEYQRALGEMHVRQNAQAAPRAKSREAA